MKTIIFTAIYLMAINVSCATPQNLGAENKHLDFALQELHKTCALGVNAPNTAEDIELAHYCYSTGEIIALQAAQSAAQRDLAKTTVAGWITGLAKQLAMQSSF